MFLAADKVRLQDLDEALRKYLAWSSILDEKETLNLDPHQVRQAETQRQVADGAVTARLPETYQWLLVPEQKSPTAPVTWTAVRLTGSGELAVRASKSLRSDELLVTSLGSTMLRKYLDDVPLWRSDHVPIRQLVEDFACYIYLPRLQSPGVLMQAIRDGVSLLTWQSDTFAYAESYDEGAGRYRGLRAGKLVSVLPEDPGLLVKPDVARRQIEAERAAREENTGAGTIVDGGVAPPEDGPRGPGSQEPEGAPPAGSVLPRRFHGAVALDPTRVGRDAGRIAEEVIAHLTGLVGADVRVTLEIEADIPSGAPENVVRTVTENSRTLKFRSQGFERE